MTVCIAAKLVWFEDGVTHQGVIVAADRMLTAGDIEYESAKWKIGYLTTRVAVLLAGETVIHSEAILNSQREFAENPITDVEEVAEIYATYLRRIKARYASQTFLSPLGLDEESFLQKSSTMSPSLVSDLTQQLQKYRIDVAAIIAGCDDAGAAHIFVVDEVGTVTCHNDVGFASIGAGVGTQIPVLCFLNMLPMPRATPTPFSRSIPRKSGQRLLPE